MRTKMNKWFKDKLIWQTILTIYLEVEIFLNIHDCFSILCARGFCSNVENPE